MRAILTYHSIDRSGSPISISEEAFARHVAWLASGRVQVTTVDRLLRLPDTADAVALAFDDGFRNFSDVAAPLLCGHGLPATIFVVADHVGGTNAWGRKREPGIPELPLLDWPELERLAALGVTVAAHTRSHRPLTVLSETELADEIAGAAHLITRRTGLAPAGFAYPYGAVTDAAAALVGATYAWGCTTELRALREDNDRVRLPRIDMYYFRERGRIESWGTTRFSYYLKLRSQARRFRQRWASPTLAP